jgi:phage/plasmid-associated DNA primase
MLWHLREVVCSGSREHFRYLLVWMAHAIQRPYEAPGVVVVLRSKIEGTGKTTVCNWLTDMFGGHALMLNTSDQLLGKFNAHLETLSLIVVNEPSWAGNRDDAAKLKSMITDPTLVIERKHGGVYQIPNILHFMFTTNAEWAIPAGAGARRFFLLDVATTKVGDRSYFEALYAEADNGGVEALMYILQRVRLDHFNPRAVPITDALREQQERSLSLEADWGLDLADRGCSQARGLGPSGTIAFGQPVDVRALYDDYVAYAASRRARAMSTEVFGKWLAKVGLDRHRTRTKRQRILLPPDEFAALIRKDAGIHS